MAVGDDWKVSDLVGDDGEWDAEKLDLYPPDIQQDIFNIPLLILMASMGSNRLTSFFAVLYMTLEPLTPYDSSLGDLIFPDELSG